MVGLLDYLEAGQIRSALVRYYDRMAGSAPEGNDGRVFRTRQFSRPHGSAEVEGRVGKEQTWIINSIFLSSS